MRSSRVDTRLPWTLVCDALATNQAVDCRLVAVFRLQRHKAAGHCVEVLLIQPAPLFLRHSRHLREESGLCLVTHSALTFVADPDKDEASQVRLPEDPWGVETSDIQQGGSAQADKRADAVPGPGSGLTIAMQTCA